MGISFLISMRMFFLVLSLLLLAQSPKSVAFGLPIQTKICGYNRFIYSSNSTDDFFSVNGRLVNNDAFCKALSSHIASRCFIAEDDSYRLCGFDISLGRNSLNRCNGKKHKRRNLQNSEPNQNEDQKSLITSKSLAIAAPAGFLIICCGFLCPCLWARRKQTEHSVLSKEFHSIDSASSLKMISIHEKNPGSPLRDKFPGSPFPGSPLRVKIPGSPLRVPPSPSRFSTSPKLTRFGSINLNIAQVVKATQNFSTSMRLGEGGFGTVYKAKLPDGQIVAIKRAKKEYFESLKNEFSSEVDLLAKIEHRNLVKLLGYLDNGNERLVFTEYVPNGTLREHLDGLKGKVLDFNKRLEISIDIAHALTYLHLYSEKQIIHRDVKSSNILLTESMRAKVANFGFARLGTVDAEKTHVSTKVKGTIGYLDPEYMITYQLTPKSDVYSFGVLMIEILTGRRPVELNKHVDERVTLRWAFKLFIDGKVRMLPDPLMQEVVSRGVLTKMFELAFQCAAPTRSERPDMKSVGEQLWAIRMDYLRSARGG